MGIDAADATAAFVYLLPAGMAAVKETLVSLLKRGGRVASYGKMDGLLSKVSLKEENSLSIEPSERQ